LMADRSVPEEAPGTQFDADADADADADVA
jgi:hypothetical protein